ncbi:Holliday junction resolvase RuvX [Desulfolutivibrio sulfoxidireducens]|uniref:Holliday junction resolvase RuvX n=1 Tax=Desulfolutivibrio sulfoxidireducens TaxID=2773299 RepID=UPI00159E3A21|nr:Holliday junction resolvase RuvX [Desulfolutivibrio sulfoxidireducens]QLA17107.1 Holliday junction resolvase RuvX [Desulfolutivibrio sulfoxidireducens]
MKILGIDFGLARVGLAVTDPDGRVAFPVKTITRTTRKALFDELAAVITAQGVERIVVGLPRPLDGVPGREAETVRQIHNFVQSLARRTPVPIELVDETLSSAQAAEDLRAAGLSGKRLREALDAQAAVRIVNTFVSGREGEPCAT